MPAPICVVGYKPNAQLIASAPELLAALRLALKCADDHGGDHFGYGEFADIARAAIAKAELVAAMHS